MRRKGGRSGRSGKVARRDEWKNRWPQQMRHRNGWGKGKSRTCSWQRSAGERKKGMKGILLGQGYLGGGGMRGGGQCEGLEGNQG